MAFRKSVLYTRSSINNWREFCSSPKYLEVSVNNITGISTVTMNNPPVNILNLEFLAEFSDVLTDLKKNNVRGMILTSFSNKVFSVGANIMEFYRPDFERFKQFSTHMQDVWMKLYGSSFPTVAVINGFSAGGGCLLALSCEYCVMVNNFLIGMNETQVGVPPPAWFIKTMLHTTNIRNTELALTTGNLFNTDEAFNMGLIDEIAIDKADALNKATAFFEKFKTIPPIARTYTKNHLRGPHVEDLKHNREKDLQTYFSYISQPEVQQSLELYLSLLKNKPKKSA